MALAKDTTLLSEVVPGPEPLGLASEKASVVSGKCCYRGPKDCDSERDWCSQDAARCDKCTGTFFNTSELLAATALLSEVAPEPLKLAAEGSGKCCYGSMHTGSTNCDTPSDYCSKSQYHCSSCGGRFHADLAEADKKPNAKAAGENATALLSEVAPEPLMLAAELSADHAAWCEHERVDEKNCAAWIADQVARHKARRSDEATRRELRQADEATRREARRADKEARKDRANTTALAETADGGDVLLLAAAPGSQTPHSESQQPQRAPTAVETLKQHREQPQYGEQPEQPEQPRRQRQQGQQKEQQEMGNWEVFVPAQFARFAENEQEKHHKATAAASFLGVQETSASDSLSLPAIAALTLTGCALLLMASVRFFTTWRTVALNSEALG